MNEVRRYFKPNHRVRSRLSLISQLHTLRVVHQQESCGHTHGKYDIQQPTQTQEISKDIKWINTSKGMCKDRQYQSNERTMRFVRGCRASRNLVQLGRCHLKKIILKSLQIACKSITNTIRTSLTHCHHQSIDVNNIDNQGVNIRRLKHRRSTH